MESAAAVCKLIRSLYGDRVLILTLFAATDMRVQFVLGMQVAQVDVFITRELTNDHTPVKFLLKQEVSARLPRLDGAQRAQMLLR